MWVALTFTVASNSVDGGGKRWYDGCMRNKRSWRVRVVEKMGLMGVLLFGSSVVEAVVARANGIVLDSSVTLAGMAALGFVMILADIYWGK